MENDELQQHKTDLGNAQWLVKKYGGDLRYCAARRMWYVWDGKRWAPDTSGEAMRFAKRAVRDLWRLGVSLVSAAAERLDAAEEVEDADDKRKAVAEAKVAVNEAKAWLAWAIQSEGRSRLESMLRLAETELPMPVSLDMLDAEPWLLNVQNGTLDLRTGTLREHRREDLITRIAPVEFDPEATDERFDVFLKEALPDDDVRRYVQTALGYSITGDAGAGNMFLPFGPTHTGKTTLLEAVKAAIGDYAVTMDVETLTSNRNRDGGRPRFDIVRLFGSRLVVSTEVPGGVRLDEALVKKLTGGDSLVARGLYERDGLEAQASFVIWLGSNYRPAVRDDDDAIWTRVRQIPFAVQHTGEARDPTLRPYLENGAGPAILAWLVNGAQAYSRDGLTAPEAVVTLTDDYRREMNPLTNWLDECCVFVTDATTTLFELRSSYEQFTPSRERVGTRRFMLCLAKVPGVVYHRETRTWQGLHLTSAS